MNPSHDDASSTKRRFGLQMTSPRIAIGLGLAAPLTILCAAGWQRSFSWPMTHDLPLMMYMAFLMDRFALLPHVDFFDMNVLGGYAAYLAIGKTFGYDALAMRWADLTVFAGIVALTLAAFRPLGRLSGWLTAVLFGISYLRMGPTLSLQREYLLLVPMLAAFAIAARWPASHPRAAPFFCGLAAGCAMTIKPPMGVIVLPLLVFLVRERRAMPASSPSLVVDISAVSAFLAAGVSIPLLTAACVLAYLGVLGAFVEIASSYLPLYGSMTAGHQVVAPSERLSYLLDAWFLFAPQDPWALGAALGAGAFFTGNSSSDSPQRRLASLVVGMTLAAALYPAIAGQFWKYHWLPYVYWILASSSLAFARISTWKELRSVCVPVALILLLILNTIRPDRAWGRLLIDHFPVEGTRPAEIAAFLEQRLAPGDTVQGMDWTDTGVIHGLLLAGARTATPFLSDFHFNHHVSTDYIRTLRDRFTMALDDSDARFVVRGKVGPFPSGPDTSRAFPALEALIARDYRRVVERPGYDIYERVR
jgi:hypothetical protein